MVETGTMNLYVRPLVQMGRARPADALPLAGGWSWFSHVEVLERGRPPTMVPARDLSDAIAHRLTAPRPDVAGLSMDIPRLMGILNVTPDSFSDGGRYLDPGAAIVQARAMAAADILDIGGESTRPGAVTVPEAEEIARTAPVISAIRSEWPGPISIDTRKAAVAQAALDAGADVINDVAALTYDPAMAGLCAESGAPVCLMHAQGDPETMQDAPHYNDVLLDVYDWLEARVRAAEAAGIPRERIVVDPGIGFGKTVQHNLALLSGLSLFHGLGCPLLLGASRKRFIGTLGGAEMATERMPGSVAVALAGIAQGVQIVRVHDIVETRQAVTLWRAATTGESA